MKTLKTLAIYLCITSSVMAMGDLPRAKMTVRAVDAETGKPISNALVRTRFLIKDHWNKADEYATHEKSTNTEGLCVFEEDSLSTSFGGRVTMAGYYRSNFKLPYTGKNRLLNRWEPWNPTVEVRLRPIKDPFPMVHKRLLREKIPIKKGNIGFDLEVADWVEPDGRGKLSDFVFTLTPVTEPKQGIKYSITFREPYDGIQEYVAPENLQGSAHFFPYEAPTNGYSPMLNKYRLLYYPVIPNYPANNLKENWEVNYIFRVRTKVDQHGEIVSANYGRIEGEVVLSDTPLIDLAYWFNPVSNERSLEWNGENLLEK